ncbi:adenylate/guanylate cyclase domain-containing protein [Spirulina subsalsa]|uniref:adenylate/guanylate cyclase domain-containing protein n=1 Tax=Spirulina subsalsa TaxID=54311 RepID=UPI00030B2123|nr:adenylate/guanylate cyclase domain-containing protein [Spirulina subsalsa]
MSVLFSDIRNFTRLSEQMSPEKTFQFINDYLSWMNPAILQNNGFIDKYIGDGIMALFAQSPDDAVKAGIGLLERLNQYNQHRVTQGKSDLEIGIGINTGVLMLGTVGSANRMENTVISDAVNLASRIEQLTKTYGIPLLISESTFNQLKEGLNYIREIDHVKVKGKSQGVTIYEVFAADPLPIREQKQQTLTLFQQAIEQYRLFSFERAESLFSECLTLNPFDKVAKVYLNRCQEKYYHFKVSILEESFRLLKQHSDQFTDVFYTCLFEKIPESRAMFTQTDMTKQKQKLWGSVELVYENLRRPELLSGALKGLGATHVQYGIESQHYQRAGEVFLETCATCLGTAWTPDVQEAWADAYATIQALMLQGAESINNGSTGREN